MLTRFRGWLAPPVFDGDEERSSAAAVLNTLALFVLAVVVLFVLANLISSQAISPLVAGIIAALVAVNVAALFLLRQGHVRLVGVLLSGVLWAGFTLPALQFGGLHDTAIGGYFVVVLLAGIGGGGAALLAFSLLCLASVGAIFAAESLDLIQPSIVLPSAYNDLILLVLLLAASAVLLRYALRRIETAYARVRLGADALAESNARLEASRDALAAQASELERRTRYLEANAEVVHQASSTLAVEQLLPRVVTLVADRFGLFRMGIFLVDSNKEWAVLQAVSGQGGAQLQEGGFRVRVDGQGIVAQVIRSGHWYMAPDVTHDPLYLSVDDVADTRSELTLPLLARGEVLGALSVQSPDVNAFRDQDISALQTLADQVALAINNAQLFERAQASLEAERRAYGELSREGWRELVRAQPDLAVLRDERGLSNIRTWHDEEVERVLETGGMVVSPGVAAKLAVPIRMRGEIIGVIDAHKPPGSSGWTPDQTALIETISDQLAGALESARLYHGTQQRAARERLIGEVTARVRESLDIETVLQTAARELQEVFNLAEVELRIHGGLGPLGPQAADAARGYAEGEGR